MKRSNTKMPSAGKQTSIRDVAFFNLLPLSATRAAADGLIIRVVVVGPGVGGGGEIMT